MLVRLSIEKQKKFRNECSWNFTSGFLLFAYGLVKYFYFFFFLNNNFFLCLNLIPPCILFYFAFASSTEHCCPICTKLCNIHQHNIVINLYKKKSFQVVIYIIYVTRNLEVCCFLSSLLLWGIYLHIFLNLLLREFFSYCLVHL